MDGNLTGGVILMYSVDEPIVDANLSEDNMSLTYGNVEYKFINVEKGE
jgi:hypothetical protein